MLIASNFLLWVVVALLSVAVVAQARQIAALRGAGQPEEDRSPAKGLRDIDPA